MICKLSIVDFQDILTVVNQAATVYKGKIPDDRWKIPYMSAQELKDEIQKGIQFYGLKELDSLIAVMGIQLVNDVTLIRHAYVLTSHQRIGVGEVYVGTWEAAGWAIKFYEKHGFRIVLEEAKNKLLKKYWCIPERQIETSVVLELQRQSQ